jgi:uncharacterized protein (DUF58 family)
MTHWRCCFSMQTFEWTLQTKIVFFLSLLSFLNGFLFSNIFLVLTGSFLLLFLVHSKHAFEQGFGSVSIKRQFLEKILYANHPCHVKTTINFQGGRCFLYIEETLPPAASITRGTNKQNIKLSNSKEITSSYQIVFHQRGRHKFLPIKLVLQDKMKLFLLTTTISLKDSVLVHSDPKDIQKAKRASALQDDSLVIPSLAGMQELVEFEGIRKYYPGDLLSHIDWKASSRLQYLVSKTFEKKETIQTIIFLDVSQSMKRSLGKYTKLDHAIAIVVQLAAMLQRQHHSVGFVAFDEYKVITHISASFDYQGIFNACANLPSSKNVKTYYPFFADGKLQTSIEETEVDKQFLNTISPFISQTKKQVKNRLQTTGIYQAVTPFLKTNKKSHFVYITDLETNHDFLYSMVTRCHLQHHKQWLITLFTPWYDTDNNHKNKVEHIEKIYQVQEARNHLLSKIRKKNIEILDLTPEKQASHIMQSVRRKKK